MEHISVSSKQFYHEPGHAMRFRDKTFLIPLSKFKKKFVIKLINKHFTIYNFINKLNLFKIKFLTKILVKFSLFHQSRII